MSQFELAGGSPAQPLTATATRTQARRGPRLRRSWITFQRRTQLPPRSERSKIAGVPGPRRRGERLLSCPGLEHARGGSRSLFAVAIAAATVHDRAPFGRWDLDALDRGRCVQRLRPDTERATAFPRRSSWLDPAARHHGRG